MNTDELKAAAEVVAQMPDWGDILGMDKGGHGIEPSPRRCDLFGGAVVSQEHYAALLLVGRAHLARLAADEAERSEQVLCDGGPWFMKIRGGVCEIIDDVGVCVHKSCDQMSTATHFAMTLAAHRKHLAADEAERVARGRNALHKRSDGNGLDWLLDGDDVQLRIDPASRMVEALRALGVELKGGGE